ncbi:MAG: hypothetical protein BWY26_01014 [Elusimicrobia bacterium ADurb.Bin231]|nr:MAG: hypothetical protein BWY26_01014 [Elusimicrobia bacterium ADurb.Bin231]
MTSSKQDIKFIKNYLKELQKSYKILSEITYEDLIISSDQGDVPTTSSEAERVARLADEYGFDGTLYRNLIPDFDDNPTSLQSMRHLRKQIEVIPKIIAKIEKTIKTKNKEIIKPKDLVDLAKALTQVHISRTQIKRDIAAGKIKSYRKSPRGKHIVSFSEIRNVYLTK